MKNLFIFTFVTEIVIQKKLEIIFLFNDVKKLEKLEIICNFRDDKTT